MPKTSLPLLLLASGVLLAGCAAKDDDPSLFGVAGATETRLAPSAITESSVISTEATVVSIDQATRMVTLRTPDQRLHVVKVDPAVRNLSHVRKGDQVIWLQHHLASFDGVVAINGTFDAATDQAVRNFQSSRGLPVTGVTDALTWQAVLGLPFKPVAWTR